MMLSEDQFDLLRRLLDERVGMSLEPDQEVFAANRLLAVAVRHGWNDLEPLLARLADCKDRLLVQEVVESLVTHETSFFRDPHYFNELAEHVLPRLIARRAAERRLTIWCAACSTGQEAYSLAMILRERFAEQLRGWEIDLLATDVSLTALAQARSGRYSDVEVRRGLSDARLAQHFRKESTGWRIGAHLQQMVRFQQANLIEAWPKLQGLDLVLLRNVLIYMSNATRHSILTRMEQVLSPDGCLMLGSSESASAPELRIDYVRPRTVS